MKKKYKAEEEKALFETDYSDIKPIEKYFHNLTGITFENQISILTSKVTLFCKKRGIHSFSKLLQDIQHNEELKQELIDCLTTNETFFYREFAQIEELVRLVKQSTGQIKILCAPSATGEETYSIAIALLEAGISSTRFSIMGVDINTDAINKAKNAVYTQRNVRNLSSSIISKYFTVENTYYALNQNVKSLVTFKVSNIFDSNFPTLGKFDFIFSRNMLIYFDSATKLKAKYILENMRKSEDYEVFFGHADLF